MGKSGKLDTRDGPKTSWFYMLSPSEALLIWLILIDLIRLYNDQSID